MSSFRVDSLVTKLLEIANQPVTSSSRHDTFWAFLDGIWNTLAEHAPDVSATLISAFLNALGSASTTSNASSLVLDFVETHAAALARMRVQNDANTHELCLLFGPLVISNYDGLAIEPPSPIYLASKNGIPEQVENKIPAICYLKPSAMLSIEHKLAHHRAALDWLVTNAESRLDPIWFHRQMIAELLTIRTQYAQAANELTLLALDSAHGDAGDDARVRTYLSISHLYFCAADYVLAEEYYNRASFFSGARVIACCPAVGLRYRIMQLLVLDLRGRFAEVAQRATDLIKQVEENAADATVLASCVSPLVFLQTPLRLLRFAAGAALLAGAGSGVGVLSDGRKGTLYKRVMAESNNECLRLLGQALHRLKRGQLFKREDVDAISNSLTSWHLRRDKTVSKGVFSLFDIAIARHNAQLLAKYYTSVPLGESLAKLLCLSVGETGDQEKNTISVEAAWDIVSDMITEGILKARINQPGALLEYLGEPKSQVRCALWRDHLSLVCTHLDNVKKKISNDYRKIHGQ